MKKKNSKYKKKIKLKLKIIGKKKIIIGNCFIVFFGIFQDYKKKKLNKNNRKIN